MNKEDFVSKTKSKNRLVVYHLSSEENTLSKMPKYNGFSVGYGVHGDVKYSRAKEKRKFRRLIKEEE